MMNAVSQFLSLRDIVALGGVCARMRMDDAVLESIVNVRIGEYDDLAKFLTKILGNKRRDMRKPRGMQTGIFALCIQERMNIGCMRGVILVIPNGPHCDGKNEHLFPSIIRGVIDDGKTFEVYRKNLSLSLPIVGDKFEYQVKIIYPRMYVEFTGLFEKIDDVYESYNRTCTLEFGNERVGILRGFLRFLVGLFFRARRHGRL